jgi:Tfp pilus assembly protein PilF
MKGLDMTKEDDAQQGWDLMANREWEQAEACFRQVLAVDPFYPDALTGMAALYLRLDEIEQARELCEMATSQA